MRYFILTICFSCALPASVTHCSSAEVYNQHTLSPKITIDGENLLSGVWGNSHSLPQPVASYQYLYNTIKGTLNIYYPSVEAPDAQTELLADSLVDILLPKLPNNSKIVDMGSGTGLHSFIGGKYSQLHGKNFRVFSVDLVYEASRTTLENLRDNAVSNGTFVLNGNMFGSLNASLRANVALILSNPPMMPATISELSELSAESIGNLDYAAGSQNGYFSERKVTDGLGVFRRIVAEGKNLLMHGGTIAIVTADFLGEQKMREIFAEHGLQFNTIAEAPRKIRRGGVTWHHMEIIEQLSGYKFFDEQGNRFNSVAEAKASGKELYHNIKVYTGTNPVSLPLKHPSLHEKNPSIDPTIIAPLEQAI